MGAHKLFKNTGNDPKIYLTKFSAKMFGILMKKRLHWVSVVCEYNPQYSHLEQQTAAISIIVSLSNKRIYLEHDFCLF